MMFIEEDKEERVGENFAAQIPERQRRTTCQCNEEDGENVCNYYVERHYLNDYCIKEIGLENIPENESDSIDSWEMLSVKSNKSQKIAAGFDRFPQFKNSSKKVKPHTRSYKDQQVQM